MTHVLASAERRQTAQPHRGQRGRVDHWAPAGTQHAVWRSPGWVPDNTTACGLSVSRLHLFPDVAFEISSGQLVCPDCRRVVGVRLGVAAPTLPSIVVAVPARNEEALIRGCLESVLEAIDHAQRSGVVAGCTVQVVAHDSSDLTFSIASDVLAPSGGSVNRLDAGGGVGKARDLAVRAGLERLEASRRDTWVCSTDADTLVPPDWLANIVLQAKRSGAVCVAGLADIDAWTGTAEGLAAYEQILAAKLYHDPAGVSTHGHVYGANLAVRADVYAAVGGFAHDHHGEDQRLVEAVAAAGHRVLRTQAIRVTTSGRTHGRASDGLADLLRGLTQVSTRRSA